MQKTQTKKYLVASPFKFSESAKTKAKSVLYHSKICSDFSIPEVMSWKSCLGKLTLKSSPGSPILAIMYWQSVLAFLIYIPSSFCPVLLVQFELFCLGFSFLAVMSPAFLSCLSCYKRPVLAVLSWQCCAISPVLSLLSASPVLDVLFWLFATVPGSSINSWDSWYIFNLRKINTCYCMTYLIHEKSGKRMLASKYMYIHQ